MDAASVMEQYIADLNNLPAEIAYVLDEIADKDNKFYETRKRIQQRDNQIHKFIKTHGSLAENSKEASSYPKIRADFDKGQELQLDKLDLAYTGLYIISRQVKKLNDQIRKLEDEGLLAPLADGALSTLNIDSEIRKSLTGSATSRVSNISAANGEIVSQSRQSTPSMRPLKRARGQSSILADDGSMSHAATHPPKGHRTHLQSGDDDEVLYCICQRASYGNMVGCDNPDCQFEWFHYECVGLKEPPTGTWYCPDCSKDKNSGDFREIKHKKN